MEYYLDGSEAVCKYISSTGESKVLTVRDCDLIIPCTQDELKDILLKHEDTILFDFQDEPRLGTVVPENKVSVQVYIFPSVKTDIVLSITEKIVTKDCYFIKDSVKKYLYVNVEKTLPA